MRLGSSHVSRHTAEIPKLGNPSIVSGNQNLWCSRNDSTNSFTAFMIANKVRLDRNTTQGTSAAGLAVGTKYTLTADYGTGEGEVRTVAPDASVTTITDLGTGEYDPEQRSESRRIHFCKRCLL